MPLFLVTGLPGTGKSTVNAELKARGYESYDGDEDHLASWYSSKTGLPVEAKIEDCTPAFLRVHSRDISRKTIEKLTAKAQDKPVFLCGDPENEAELHDLFVEIFGLVIDDEALKHRLATRTNNAWGKLPHELEYSLAFKRKWYDNCARFSYITLDASQSPQVLVDQLLAMI